MESADKLNSQSDVNEDEISSENSKDTNRKLLYKKLEALKYKVIFKCLFITAVCLVLMWGVVLNELKFRLLISLSDFFHSRYDSSLLSRLNNTNFNKK